MLPIIWAVKNDDMPDDPRQRFAPRNETDDKDWLVMLYAWTLFHQFDMKEAVKRFQARYPHFKEAKFCWFVSRFGQLKKIAAFESGLKPVRHDNTDDR